MPPIPRDPALFLDFDGTLVAFAPKPHLVEVDAALVPTLQTLQEHLNGALAIISGRTLPELDDFLRPMEFPAAGNHGRDLRFYSGKLENGSMPDITDELLRVEKFAATRPGVLVERKEGAVALHYRQAPEFEADIRALLEGMAQQRDDLTTMDNKMLVELKDAGSNKGNAVQAMMPHTPFSGRTPVFVGDDRNDEAGFLAAARLGGFGVKVGPGETAAEHRLENVSAVHDWLRQLAGNLA